VSILPALIGVGHVIRRSTSAGLYRTDTGEQLPGSNNAHIYIAIRDGADGIRFLHTLHDRCWLAGYGWYMVGAGGQLLERSIIDRTVGGAEHLAFEGPPILIHPVAQDTDARKPIAVERFRWFAWNLHARARVVFGMIGTKKSNAFWNLYRIGNRQNRPNRTRPQRLASTYSQRAPESFMTSHHQKQRWGASSKE
jgi:hypothetical protein